MLTGLKFDLLMRSLFLWRGVTCARFRESGKVDVCIDKFIKPRQRGLENRFTQFFLILHDNLSTLVAFNICIY